MIHTQTVDFRRLDEPQVRDAAIGPGRVAET